MFLEISQNSQEITCARVSFLISLISLLRIWSHLPKKSFMENFIFCGLCFCVDEHWYVNKLPYQDQTNQSAPKTVHKTLCQLLVVFPPTIYRCENVCSYTISVLQKCLILPKISCNLPNYWSSAAHLYLKFTTENRGSFTLHSNKNKNQRNVLSPF